MKISKNTVRGYLKRAWTYSSDLSKVLSLDEESLSKLFFGTQGQKADNRAALFQNNVKYWLTELHGVGVTKQMLRHEYRLKRPEGFGYDEVIPSEQPISHNVKLILLQILEDRYEVSSIMYSLFLVL